MNKINYMYCISIDNNILDKIVNLGYLPVGLGNQILPVNGLLIKMVKIFLIKINFMENILFIIIFGKTYFTKYPIMNG